MSPLTLEQEYCSTRNVGQGGAVWVRIKADGAAWAHVEFDSTPSRDPSVKDISAVFDDVEFSDEESAEIDAILAQGRARLTVPSLRLREIE